MIHVVRKIEYDNFDHKDNLFRIDYGHGVFFRIHHTNCCMFLDNIFHLSLDVIIKFSCHDSYLDIDYIHHELDLV